MLTYHHALEITKVNSMVEDDVIVAWNNAHAPEEVRRHCYVIYIHAYRDTYIHTYIHRYQRNVPPTPLREIGVIDIYSYFLPRLNSRIKTL